MTEKTTVGGYTREKILLLVVGSILIVYNT